MERTQDIAIQARHIPGCLNVIANRLSLPNQPTTTEWSLHPEIVNQIFGTWETPNSGHVCHSPQHASPQFMSTIPKNRAMALDALSQDWQGRCTCFHRFLNKVIQKLRTTHEGKVILIAPWWLSQPWFSHVLHLCVDHPLIIPYRWDLLSRQGYVTNGKSYHLQAWRLSCSTTAGLSKEVSRLTTALRRPSTNRMYVDRWLCFTSMELQWPRMTPVLPQWDPGIVLEALS